MHRPLKNKLLAIAALGALVVTVAGCQSEAGASDPATTAAPGAAAKGGPSTTAPTAGSGAKGVTSTASGKQGDPEQQRIIDMEQQAK